MSILGDLGDQINRLWEELEGVVAHLPTEEAEQRRGGGALLRFPDDDADLEERVDLRDAEEYLFGRLLFQVSRRLKKYVERQEIEKVREIWGELSDHASYIEEAVPLSLQEQGEGIIDQLEAFTLRRHIVVIKRSDPEAAFSKISLDLVDPLLLDILAKHPDILRTLDWRVFERLLARILEDLGYEIELQRGTKDGGVDIFALRKDNIFGPHRYLLQAKRWSNAVGVEPVRELLFLHSHHKITRSCLATTSRFTSGAWELARDYAWQLELRDFEKLQEWINLSRNKGKKANRLA